MDSATPLSAVKSQDSSDHFDLIVVGSGVASSFFLQGVLHGSRPPGRVLVLEAGGRFSHAEQLAERKAWTKESHRHFVNRTPEKVWHFSRTFGGGTNCWFGTTPRMLPEDFQLRSRFGVGDDWPLTYDELEPFYTQAERLMQVSGEPEMPYRMSAPYPLPAHRFSEPDTLLKRAYPREFFHLPTARSSRLSVRPICCNNGVCSLCPVDAKFTITNGLAAIYEHPAVTLRVGSPARRLLHSADTVTGVVFTDEAGVERRATADLVVLGANAIFNPHLLLKSGIAHPGTGEGLCEQVGATAMITLDGLQNLLGSTVTTGLGFNDMFGEHRRERGAFLYHTVNRATNLSLVPGRELARLEVIVAIEDLRQASNRVTVDPREEMPIVEHPRHSAYAQRTVDQLPGLLARYLAPLPIVEFDVIRARPTESHIQGTTVMGAKAATSVVDRHSVHHRMRNLVVLGSGTFPTASPANPTLTIAALALMSASHLFS
ncbi:MAG TPA: GMC family oxidoreductase [Candidatus Synoicihabitans sp.]|nr:GMC family oxidoreductase [Candidatus Synoicihabitans sp.]